MAKVKYFDECFCPVCGKFFVIPPANTYKLIVNNTRVDCCSYTCFRKMQAKRENMRVNKRRV